MAGITAEDGLGPQINRFLERLLAKNANSPSFQPEDTTYGMCYRPLHCDKDSDNPRLLAIFFGINDCFRRDENELEAIVESIFDGALHKLYVKAHARNFLLFDVPPVDRSPLGK